MVDDWIGKEHNCVHQLFPLSGGRWFKGLRNWNAVENVIVDEVATNNEQKQ